MALALKGVKNFEFFIALFLLFSFRSSIFQHYRLYQHVFANKRPAQIATMPLEVSQAAHFLFLVCSLIRLVLCIFPDGDS